MDINKPIDLDGLSLSVVIPAFNEEGGIRETIEEVQAALNKALAEEKGAAHGHEHGHDEHGHGHKEGEHGDCDCGHDHAEGGHDGHEHGHKEHGDRSAD